MLSKRIRALNSIKIDSGDCAIYIMSRDQRVKDNHALLAAQKSAIKHDVPLIVYFVLYPTVKNRLKNQFVWMLDGLKEVEKDLRDLNIAFNIKIGTATEKYTEIENEHNPLAIFFDFSPLKGPRKTKEAFATNSNTPAYIIDTHNTVPVWEASNKEETGARTIRKKILNQLDTYLVEPETIKKQKTYSGKNEIDWKKLEDSIEAEFKDDYKPVITPGENEALRTLNDFIENKLENYTDLRNDPAHNHLSNLSAYFHYGQLSVLRAALEIKKVYPKAFKLPKMNTESELEESIQSFLEESIIRKELSDNYCYYNKNYDNLKGASNWARESLEKHKNDKREYIYSYADLEQAKTHDKAWNAAQLQMTKTGKMHGYMRMYWAKKILEWTNAPEEALKFAIKLNDKYELDGYDPNGYVGCMWSIAGVHDRGWTEREIFGKIRYMNFNGLKRKFDIEKYIETWI